ncbi:Cthe_2314 family HEPN domain-containing protein [Staphylococcus hominis]|uniref:Cthe_2314 family HEPN domain-containing protein n=1 Tax=Staphylococcus hominis TaxID=1290 RepID=UPI002878F263|nr:Cthe_2314 family HEPN domain-containing protein [Staphylococcus hominis]MDS3879370.1 Cthe_2314 family HEPN domain-containing protein [Staphylococcus hominis]
MIEIKWFNDIENAKLGKHPDKITSKIDEILNIKYGIRDISFLLSSISSEHWLRILNNRTQNIMISYDFAMFYFEKGINDQSFPKDTEQINYENLYSFKYFIENFFIGGFSIYENIGHIINDIYHLEKIYEDGYEKTQISFKSVVNNLSKKVNRKEQSINKNIKKLKKEMQKSNIEKKVELDGLIQKFEDKKKDICKMKEYIKKINSIKNSKDFKDTERIRHNIVHNNPPLTLENPVIHGKKGISTVGKGRYMNSDTIKNYMDIFLEQYFEILTIIKEMLECSNWIKECDF